MRGTLLLVLAVASCRPSGPAAPTAGVDSAGDPLPPGAIARIGTTRLCAPCVAGAFSADGSSVVAACVDGYVRTFDVATGKETASFVAHDVDGPTTAGELMGGDARLSSACFSPDRTRLVTSGEGTLRLWEVSTGEMLAECSGLREADRVAFAPNGRTVHVDQRLALHTWDTASGAVAETQVRLGSPSVGLLDRVPHFAFLGVLPTRDAVIARPARDDRGAPGATIFDLSAGRRVDLLVPFVVGFASSSPDGMRLALVGHTSSSNDFVRPLAVCDADSGAVLVSRQLRGAYRDPAWSPDGRCLAVSSSSGVVLLDATTLATIRTLAHGEPIAFSSDGGRLLLRDRWTLRVLDVATSAQTVPSSPLVRGFRWADGGRRIEALREDETWGCFDAETGVLTGTAANRADEPDAWVPQEDGTVRWYDRESMSEVLKDRAFWVRQRVARSAGPRVLGYRWRRHDTPDLLVVRDVDADREVRRDRVHEDISWTSELSASGRWLAWLSESRTLVLTDVDADADVAEWPCPADTRNLSLAVADGASRVATSDARTVMVFEAGRRDPLRTWERLHEDHPPAVWISDDGSRVAFRARWEALVWDVDANELILRASGHRCPPLGLAFSPDGTRIATSSDDGTILVWGLPPAPR